jgi:EpsD family peptidyl-prolyl cis-trans isomerase
MRGTSARLAACLTLVLLVGCDRFPGGDGKGPVAATVDGETISVAQIDAELKAANTPNASDPQVRQAALQQIVIRKLLADDARARKLDATDEAKALKVAAVENFEAALVREDLVKNTASPTDADVQAYMQANPQVFGDRRIYLVERIFLAASPAPDVARALEPANTWEDVVKVLQEHHVPLRVAGEQMESARMPPAVAAQMASLGPGIPFVLPTPSGVSINRIRESRPQPLPAGDAKGMARQMATREAQQKAMSSYAESLKKAAAAKITYSDGYGPPEKKAAKTAR